MVVLDKYLDDIDNEEADLPPSYDTITVASSSTVIDEKPRPSPPTAPRPAPRPTAPSSSSTWFSFLPNARIKQTHQTVISLLHDLVATTTTENSAAAPILASCASALSPSSFSTLLQQPTFEGHTPIYWAILNRHAHILPDMLQYAGPLNNACIADIRLACLASGDQVLFGKLRRGELPFITTLARADTLILGSTSADDIDVREVDGEAAFSASIKIRLWQKRMRVAGLVNVEFIARGRIWSLTFFSLPSPSSFSSSLTTRGAGIGPWRVALSLMEHSPPTFVDGRLVIDVFCPRSSSISLPSESSSPAHSRYPSLPSTPVPTSPTQAKPPVEIPLQSASRLAHRTLDGCVFNVLDLGRGGVGGASSQQIPQPAVWSEEGTRYTNALVGVLSDDLGWDKTPYLAPDGTLHARLDARLEKAEGGCIIC